MEKMFHNLPEPKGEKSKSENRIIQGDDYYKEHVEKSYKLEPVKGAEKTLALIARLVNEANHGVLGENPDLDYTAEEILEIIGLELKLGGESMDNENIEKVTHSFSIRDYFSKYGFNDGEYSSFGCSYVHEVVDCINEELNQRNINAKARYCDISTTHNGTRISVEAEGVDLSDGEAEDYLDNLGILDEVAEKMSSILKPYSEELHWEIEESWKGEES